MKKTYISPVTTVVCVLQQQMLIESIGNDKYIRFGGEYGDEEPEPR